MLRRSLIAICSLCTLFSAEGAWAQEKYPSRPIRLVVGYSPGGGNDLIARVVASRLQAKLGEPVVVDNKPGAQSILAAEIVAKAAPDGYTLFMAASGPMTINPAVYGHLPYHPIKDFVPISLVAEFPLLMVVGAEQPVKSVSDLIAYGRANPKLANYAASATPFQLAAELFNQRTNSAFQHIPYRGSGDAVQSIMSGEVLMGFADPGPLAAPLKAGKVRAIGITTARRPPDFPDVPTFVEQGIPDMEILLWTGIVAPAGTPPEIVTLLQDAVGQILEMQSVQQAFDALSVDERATTSAEFAEIISRDTERWKAVAVKANIKLD